MNLKNKKLYVPEDLWQIIQNILIYECGYMWGFGFNQKYHPYIFLDENNLLTYTDDIDYFKFHRYLEISYKDILKMENTEKYIKVDLKTAREWIRSDNETLKTLALQAFKIEELKEFDFRDIKTWDDAVKEYCKMVPELKPFDVFETYYSLETISRASAAMYKVSIIRRVLNKEYDLSLIENVPGKNYTYYPAFRLAKSYINVNGHKIGTIDYRDKSYDVYTFPFNGGGDGLSNYFGNSFTDVCIDSSLFGCATEEIAEHFGKYFGMLILKAMYIDMVKDIKFEKN